MSPAAGFVISLIVSIYCSVLAKWQGARFSGAIEGSVPTSPSSGPKEENDPEIREAYLQQLIEITYAVPSAMLTFVAFAALPGWPDDAKLWILVLALCLLSVLLWVGSPRSLSWFLTLRVRGNISLIGLSILALNVIGLVISMNVGSADGD